MLFKPACLRFSRRSIIATGTGLVLAKAWGNCARAQSADSDLPDAADVLTRFSPEPAPALAFTNAKGKKLTLADYAGHVLVVNFWATWCGPCVDEIPSFAALAPQIKGFGGLILPVSIDMDGAAAVGPFYASHAIAGLPVLLDPDADNLALLNSDGVPVSLVINAGGQAVARMDGAADWNTPALVAYLRGLGGAKPQISPDGFIPV